MDGENKIIALIRQVYKRWKRAQPAQAHPDEEDLACFAQGLLNEEEAARIKAHLTVCDDCAQAYALHLLIQDAPPAEVPPGLLVRVELAAGDDGKALWQIVLRFIGGAIEIVNAAGDILVGQELVPMPVLRSRSIKEFKDEVTIFKEFKDIRVEVRIVNKQGGSFDLSVSARNKQSNQVIKDLRVTLFKGELELESYLAEAGCVVFEHVLLGKYTVELRDDTKFATIILDIKI